MLRGVDGAQHRTVLELIRFLADEATPEIVSLPNSLLIALAPAIKRELNVPVVCTLQGEDCFLDGLGAPYRDEALRLIREHASSVDAFLAVSRFGADRMSEFLGIERSRIHIVPIGIDFEGHARAPLDAEPFTIGYLARVAPEKGLHVLCEVYRRLRARPGCPPSRLVAAGYLAPEHKGYLADVRKQMAAWGLADQFEYRGAPDRAEKIAFLQGLSVLSVPSPQPTQKGQFLLEAMASGVPVVQPRLGAFTEVVETTGGGILVDDGNLDGLVQAIASLGENPDRRKELGAAGFDAVRTHYGIPQMLASVMDVYQRLQRRPTIIRA
jgi:glycosyltransferase involved in cell wall biosynthesis